MAKGKADIANTAVRVFLQDLGVAYDEARGFAPYKGGASGKDFASVRDFFGNKCCYCGTGFSSQVRANQDHLIPTNKSDLGLHAWGNIVPACPTCNAKKHGNNWLAFIVERTKNSPGPSSVTSERVDRMNEFLAKYPYNPNLEGIRREAEALYKEVGETSITLVRIKVSAVAALLNSPKN